LASVACGRVDGYFESELNLWDMAAGLVLVAEAGGVVTDLEGNFPQKDFVLATTAELHPELIKLLRSAEYL
ncbi:MAG TPA: inositol monophosphatase, partial [Acidimicrobiia bacterium]|nr:inositol monophosphatase [Acidimicrobiia bacterium]